MTTLARRLRHPVGLALTWAVLRGPLVLALFFVYREPILEAVERVLDIIWITEFAISALSTPVSRVLVWLTAALFLFVVGQAAAPRGTAGLLAVAGALSLATFALAAAAPTESTLVRLILAVAPPLLLATNWASLSDLKRMAVSPERLGAFIAALPLLGEVLFAARYGRWVRSLAEGREPAGTLEAPPRLPGAILAGAVAAAFVPGSLLTPLEQTLRRSPDVQRFAQGNFNGLALDASGAHLFATGHGLARLVRYDTKDLARPPRESAVETGWAQGLAYDPAREEVLVHHGGRAAVLVLDARDLSLKREFSARGLAAGDPWIAAEPLSNTIVLASEADAQGGAPLLLFNRATGAVAQTRSEAAGNLLIHPSKAILYLSFFRRERGLLAIDLKTGATLARRTDADPRIDRMAHDAVDRALLVASPLAGRIQRFDETTLSPLAPLKAPFGVRVLALDEGRNLLLAGSLVTGKVTLIALPEGRAVRSWYVGPWLRSIVVNAGAGRAYISSNGALYELDYARRD